MIRCRKIRYATKDAAWAGLDRINEELRARGNRKKLARVYYCRRCRAWHTTSKADRRVLRG